MIRRALCSIALLAALPALAAVPGEINYQGLLLDAAGAPVTGAADFAFTLFDVPSGGSALWSESHPAVSVLDGVYDVVLGSTTPITPAVIGGGALYLEISVDAETLTPRQRLVAVPYALRADTAETTDSVQGLDGAFVLELFEHVSFDGGDPPNLDPSEGVSDPDQDGLPNFVDPDNDDDGLSDVAELGAGSDINLVTPTLSGFDPEPVEASLVNTVQVQGTNFSAGLTVAFGSQNPAPANLTATSFEVDVGPQAPVVANVVVTLGNGETGSGSFQFVHNQPAITDISPQFADATVATLVTITGSGFVPGLAVSFGSENPVPANLTPTSFEVTVGPQAAGQVSVVASYPSGNQDSTSFDFVGLANAKTVFVTSSSVPGDFGGIAAGDALCNSLAAAASLTGTYKAWLGDSGGDPASSFTTTEPYALVDATLIAVDFADLTDGFLGAAISVDETGAPASGPVVVWTHVDASGTSLGSGCADWTSQAGFGGVGDRTGTDSTWTSVFSVPCNNPLKLYCFEQ